MTTQENAGASSDDGSANGKNADNTTRHTVSTLVLVPEPPSLRSAPLPFTRVRIPAPVVRHLRAGLYGLLEETASALATWSWQRDREACASKCEELFERLDVLREFLDRVGWAKTDAPLNVNVEPRFYLLTVVALVKTLELERESAASNPDFTGAAAQIERARRFIDEIELFFDEYSEILVYRPSSAFNDDETGAFAAFTTVAFATARV